MSTNPGVTSAPSASTSLAPAPATEPTSTTTPSRTATSAERAGAPVPSTTEPPRITRSYSAIAASQRKSRQVDAVQVGHVVAQDGPLLLVGEMGGVLLEQ